MDLREQVLGDGSFSICRRCVHKASGQEMAVKIVSRRIDCSQEIGLLRACQGHPNVVRLQDVYYDEVCTRTPKLRKQFYVLTNQNSVNSFASLGRCIRTL